MKYTTDKASKIPAKIRNVMEVPTAGMEIKVGTNVPIMLPIVLNAPNVPTVCPLSSRLSTEYFTRDGVTVPSKITEIRRSPYTPQTLRQSGNYCSP